MESLVQYNDDQLARMVVNQNEEACNVLFNRYYQPIYRLISIYVDDKPMRADLTQDIFFKAFRYLHSFNHQAKFNTWLYRISINTIKNYYRDTSLNGYFISSFMDEYTDESQSPENNMIMIEFNSIIEHNLASLPSDMQKCYRWFLIEGRSYEEIADRLHCPIGTVRSRIHRARQFIKEANQDKREFF